MNNIKKNRGFTLIELLVVIAIIGLLSSIVLASVNTARQKAAESKSMSEIRSIQTAMNLFYNENGRMPIGTATNPSYPAFRCLGSSNCYFNGAVIPPSSYSSITLGQKIIVFLTQANTAIASDMSKFLPNAIATNPIVQVNGMNYAGPIYDLVGNNLYYTTNFSNCVVGIRLFPASGGVCKVPALGGNDYATGSY